MEVILIEGGADVGDTLDVTNELLPLDLTGGGGVDGDNFPLPQLPLSPFS